MTQLAIASSSGSTPLRTHFGIPLPLIGGLVAGLLLTAGYALDPWWWAPWLAPVPMLASCRDARDARMSGAVAGATAMVSVWTYYVAQTGWAVALVVTGLRVGGWRLASRLAVDAARRLPFWLAVPVLPAAQAGFEALTLSFSPHGAAGSLAYSQMGHPALAQAAALGGVPAVVFFVLLPGSLLGLRIAVRPVGGQARFAAGIVGALGLSILALTLVRLQEVDRAARVPVAAIATDRFHGIPQDWTATWSIYRPAVLGSGRGARLTVLPEKIALVDATGAARAERDVAAAARVARTTVVLGLEVRDASGYHGRALAVAPDGHGVWYDKQRLLPGFEDRDRPGHRPVDFIVGGLRVGLAICKDMHIPDVGREYGVVSMMAVPAWDFGPDGWMGARMTAMRGIENGYAIVRASRDGLVGAYDAAGRTVAERPSGDGVVIARALLPTGIGPTPYARFGDVFGWACLAAMAALIVTPRSSTRRGTAAVSRRRVWRFAHRSLIVVATARPATDRSNTITVLIKRKWR